MSTIENDDTIADAGPGSAAAPSVGGGTTGQAAKLASVEHIELERAWQRMRLSCQIGLLVWASFISMDLAYSKWVFPGSMTALLSLRLGLLALFVPCLLILRSPNGHTHARIRLIGVVLFQGAAWSIALMTVWSGGVHSHYYAGIALVMALRVATIGEPWRKGLIPSLLMAGSYPIVILVAAAVSSEHAALLDDPSELVTWTLKCSNLLGMAIFAIIGGHVLWHGRRQVFESRSIGRYRLLRRIGKGGMGEVWAAWHRGLKREIALKLLTPKDGDGQSVIRFEREVAATVALSHPNTIRVFDHGATDDGVWYYAMELLRGDDLASAVSREGAFSVERAVHILVQASRSLAEAHAHGISHRDVKPANMFLTDDGRSTDFVKVLDFGIARTLESESGANPALTQTGWTLGTPAYLSPEAAKGGRADARSDVYALGAVLYFMLTARAPFEGYALPELLQAHLNEEPTPVAELRGVALPEDVQAVLNRAMAKAPEQRQQDAGQLVDELEQCESYGRWRPPPVALGVDRATEEPAAEGSALASADTMVSS